MERLISETYYLMQNLRKLANDAGHEMDLDHYNLRKSMKHLEAFYQEMVQAALEKQQEENLAAAKAALDSTEDPVDIE